MKQIPAILAFVVFAAMASSAFADAAYQHDLLEIQTRRDQALAAAAEPINRRYQADLEQLQRRATQAGDLDTALKIKEALGALPNGGGSPSSASGATGTTGVELVGVWRHKTGDTDRGTLVFKAGGSFITERQKEGKWSKEGKQLLLNYPNGSLERFDLPVRNRQLFGKSPNGGDISLTKE